MVEKSPVEPPGPDVNAAPKLLGITGAFYIMGLGLLGGRIYTRLRHQRLGWDDYTITAALILAIVEWALFLSSAQYGAGRHNYYISADEQIKAQHLLFASTLPWAPSMMFIKISIACMLLRIKQKRPWQIFLWSMITLQIASCIASLVFQLVECIPLSAIWDPLHYPEAVCAKPMSAFTSLYVNASIGIASDLVFAVVPLTFIRKMQRPLREKIVLSLLMGLGIFATAASIVKTTLVRHYGVTGDSLWDAIDLTLWSMLELQTGIIAACIPCLKSPFERGLNRIGLLSSLKRSTNHDTFEEFGRGDLKLAKIKPAIRKGMGIGTDVSTGASGRSTAERSEETIWPVRESEEGFWEMVAEGGGIAKTTEFQIESEMLGQIDSREENEEGEWKDEDSAKGLGGWNAV